jgi:hypothetical protein
MNDRASHYINEQEFKFPTFIEIKYSIPREDEIEGKTLGDLIKKKRLELGLTQKELAQNLNVDEDTPWGGKRSSVMINPSHNENTVHPESVYSEFCHDIAPHIHMEQLASIPDEAFVHYNNR